jgi:phosphatidylglycerophosphate synthase
LSASAPAAILAPTEELALDNPLHTVLITATRDEAPGATLEVAGLTVVERAVRQLRRMGASRIVIAADGTVALPEPLPPEVEVRALLPDRLADDLAAAQAAVNPSAVIRADVVRPSNAHLEGGIRVVDEATRRKAEDSLFADLLRGDLGFVARHINKPISFRITRHLLCKLPITPNHVTLGAAVLGLCGAALIASGRQGAMVAGFFLAQLQSILDGCDGELARVRFQQTPLGEWLDTFVDDGLNLALIAGMGVGLSRMVPDGHGNYLIAALVACGMLLTYNLIAYRELIRQGEGGEVLKVRWWFARGRDLKALAARDSSSGFGVLLAIGRRDFFILAWLVLAVCGLLPVVLLYAFLVALACFGVAVGQLVVPAKGSHGESRKEKKR